MTKLNRWALAAGASGALAFAGTAWAQSQTTTGAPQDANRTPESQAGERSPHGAQEANRGSTGGSSTGTSDSPASAAGQQERQARGGQQGAESQRSAQGQQGAQKVDKGLTERLEKIHAANQAEQHMAKVGSQQAQSPEVKQYAQTVLQDHERMDQELQQSAQQAGIQLEGKAFQKKQEDGKKDMKKLEAKRGKDFDKEFMSRMVKDHKSDLKEVQKAAKDARKQNQAELASMLDQAATGIQGHLDQAKRIEKTLGESRPAQGRRGETGADRPATRDSGSAGTTSSPSGATTPPPTEGTRDSGTQPQSSGGGKY